MDDPALALLLVIVAGVGLVALAPVLQVPYPILLLLGGAAVGFVPGLPEVVVSPDVVLLVLLPPLLYSAAFHFPLGALRRNARPIGMLAVVVVALTCLAVAVAAHVALGLSWGVAFVLGAVLGPTDPTAIEAVARRLAAPRELVAIVQGETLVNDATALTILASALALVVDGQVSAGTVGLRFVGGLVGGIVAGVAIGWLTKRVRERMDSAPEELAISLASAYVAYLLADSVETSGVIAAVVCGAYHGRRQHEWISPATRLQTFAFWELLTFLINGTLFALVGLQLPGVLDGLQSRGTGEVLGGIALLTVVVVLVRGLWVVSATTVLRVVEQRGRPVGALPNRYVAVVAACGMRGGVSLAAALSIPASIQSGDAFPERDLVLVLTFGVIVTTLVGGGLALPTLIRRLGLEGDSTVEDEEIEARRAAAKAGRERLEELQDEDWVRPETYERLHATYAFREERFGARQQGEHQEIEAQSQDYQRLRRELLRAERDALSQLRDAQRIDGDVAGRVERDLDLEDSRLDA